MSTDWTGEPVTPELLRMVADALEAERAKRIPSLPTEPHSAIRDVTTSEGRKYPLCVRMAEQWMGFISTGAWRVVYASEITAWTPAKVVADGEPVTR